MMMLVATQTMSVAREHVSLRDPCQSPARDLDDDVQDVERPEPLDALYRPVRFVTMMTCHSWCNQRTQEGERMRRISRENRRAPTITTSSRILTWTVASVSSPCESTNR